MNKWLELAEIMDAWRLVPRLLIVMYGYVCWQTWIWYTQLGDPSEWQTGFAGLIWGAAAVWWSNYIKTGRDWSNK